MKFQINVSRAAHGRWNACRFRSVLVTAFICAALFVASQSASQAAAQTRFERGIADSAQDAVSAAVATPVDAGGLSSVLEAPVPGASVSSLEEANVVNPNSSQFFSLAMENGQSSSSQNLPSGQNSSSGAAPAQPRAVKTKSPHHGLGVALAIVGSAALAVGVASYALGGIDICANEKSGGCKEARDAGLVLMPAGGGVAITGFYLQFHR